MRVGDQSNSGPRVKARKEGRIITCCSDDFLVEEATGVETDFEGSSIVELHDAWLVRL